MRFLWRQELKKITIIHRVNIFFNKIEQIKCSTLFIKKTRMKIISIYFFHDKNGCRRIIHAHSGHVQIVLTVAFHSMSHSNCLQILFFMVVCTWTEMDEFNPRVDFGISVFLLFFCPNIEEVIFFLSIQVGHICLKFLLYSFV